MNPVVKAFNPTVERGDGEASHPMLFYWLLIVLAWIPIPIGSNRGWSMAVFEVVILSIFTIWALSYARNPFDVPGSLRKARLPLAILFVWLCIPLIQLIPIPLWAGQDFSGNIHKLYSDAPGTPDPTFYYLSLDRNATLSGLLIQCTNVALFFLVVSIVNSRKRLYMLLISLFVVGSAQALYGLMVYFGGDEIGLWNPGHDPRTVSGTYVNQNHFAGLMEMTIPVGMGLLLMDPETSATKTNVRAVTRVVVSTILGKKGVFLFGILIMFAALILSTSRGAAGSLAVAVIVAATMAILSKRSRARELKVVLTGAVLAVFAVLWLGAGQLSSKLESSGLASNRGDLRELSYRIIADYPVLGTGVGTYRWVVPQYKDERFGSGFYEHAHNDYLEILGEQGILGFSLLAGGIGLIAAGILKAYRRRHEPILHGALFASVVACTSVLVHGFVDFNLQIPANAAYFFTLLGIGVVAASLGKESRS